MKVKELSILLLTPLDLEGDDAMERWKKEIEKLYFDHIFPHFRWNDLLRFRRVCKDAKELADKYIKAKGEKMCPEITIYETGSNKDKSLARFLQLGFPATSIYIMNTSGSTMFQKEERNFAKFGEQSGPGSKITQVRIRYLNNWPRGNERKFFEGLPNLKCLLVDEFGGQAHSEEEAIRRSKQVSDQWPSRFKQLTKVTIGVRPNVLSVDVILVSRSLMNRCLDLEYSADGYSSAIQVALPFNLCVVPGMTFDMIRKYIEERGAKYPTKPNLKFYDFNCFYKCGIVKEKLVEFICSHSFLELLVTCYKYSVKLLNVNSAWLQKWQPNHQFGNLVTAYYSKLSDPCSLSVPVVSMVNLHGLAIPLTMPNLEKLSIPASSRCSLLPQIWLRDRKPWPALKILEVTVDSKMLYTTVVSHDESTGKSLCLDPETTASLMKFLFVGIQRPAMRELSLTFVEGLEVDDVIVKAATSIGVCCPNLNKLTLVNWPGTNATVIKVLGDIKFLEELCVDNCKKIGDLAFLKTDTTDGIIQQQPGLKKLSFKQLDKMPKLTDKLFQDVVSQMKLSHLLLSSNKPLTNITPDGITALKNGEFAKSIEKFPFTGWSLANVSKENFKKMEKGFRSFDMI